MLVTGHTGFKGTWLSLWLATLGAEVVGVQRRPAQADSFHHRTRAAGDLAVLSADIRDSEAVDRAVRAARPDVVFHLAAQPIVREAVRAPGESYLTNVMGTVHLLESVRHVSNAQVVIVVTSDKCYRELPGGRPSREEDPLSSDNPYSASKAAVELVVEAWRSTYFDEAGVHVATARASNVVGGGDWGRDRLVPDLMRGAFSGAVVPLRRPDAVRPWQHVLALLHGYLLLAEALWDDPSAATAWNLGPPVRDVRAVGEIASALSAMWPAVRWRAATEAAGREARALLTDSTRARRRLGWEPGWSLDETLRRVVDWYLVDHAGEDVRRATLDQIHAYVHDAELSSSSAPIEAPGYLASS